MLSLIFVSVFVCVCVCARGLKWTGKDGAKTGGDEGTNGERERQTERPAPQLGSDSGPWRRGSSPAGPSGRRLGAWGFHCRVGQISTVLKQMGSGPYFSVPRRHEDQSAVARACLPPRAPFLHREKARASCAATARRLELLSTSPTESGKTPSSRENRGRRRPCARNRGAGQPRRSSGCTGLTAAGRRLRRAPLRPRPGGSGPASGPASGLSSEEPAPPRDPAAAGIAIIRRGQRNTQHRIGLAGGDLGSCRSLCLVSSESSRHPAVNVRMPPGTRNPDWAASLSLSLSLPLFLFLSLSLSPSLPLSLLHFNLSASHYGTLTAGDRRRLGSRRIVPNPGPVCD